MTTERVYSKGLSQRYPSTRKHTSEWQKNLLYVSITPTGSLPEWHLALPTSVLHAPAIRQGIACLEGFTQDKIPRIVNYSSVERSFTATCVCFIFIYLFGGEGFLFFNCWWKTYLKVLLLRFMYICILHIASTIISGKGKTKLSPFHGIVSRDDY